MRVVFKAKSLLLLLTSVLIILFFLFKIYLPIEVTLILFLFHFLYIIRQYKFGRAKGMILVFYIAYYLPFIHIIPYLFFDYNSDPIALWGLAVNEYMVQKPIIEITAMIGILGGLGMSFGSSMVTIKSISNTNVIRTDTDKSMSIYLWVLWVFFGFIFSLVSTPSDTIFQSSYATTSVNILNINLSSGWLISYIVLTYAFLDALNDSDKHRRWIKLKLFIVVLAYIAIWLQFLRGDRESLPWIAALAFIYYNEKEKSSKISISPHRIILILFIMVLMGMVIGGIRSSSLNLSFIESAKLFVEVFFYNDNFSISNFLHGTWSAVLLTPLSISGDFFHGLHTYKYGKDYFDIFLSLPPGFVADFFGYVRPLDSGVGPAWEMRYGLGGTHATVLPFRNFGIIGVFAIPAVWSFFLSAKEQVLFRRFNINDKVFFVTMIMIAPHFLWYGEKNLINALIIFFSAKILYLVCTNKKA